MEFFIILTLAGLGFTLAAPLGPVNAEMIKKTLKNSEGWKYGLITGIGAMTGDFLISMTVLFIGAEVLSSFIDIIGVKITLLLANVLILGYIGIISFKGEVKTQEVESDLPNGSSFRQYRLGFILVITSPWSYGFWATFGPVMLTLGIPLDTIAARLEATAYFISGILFWFIIFIGLLKISHEFASPKFLKKITQGSALILIIFAIKIIFDIFCILLNFCIF